MNLGPNPSGLCMCGCGGQTKLASQTSSAAGNAKNQPVRFLKHHHRLTSPVEYLVDNETGCWVWQRSKTNQGYGQIAGGKRAHRVYYERFIGPLSEGQAVHHTCHNPACVNPAHLEALDRADHDAESCLRCSRCRYRLAALGEVER